MKPFQPSRLPRLPNPKLISENGIYDQENSLQDGLKNKAISSSTNGKSTRSAASNVNKASASESSLPENQLVLVPADPLTEFESVLNERIVSKGKFDYKGKSEVFVECIKKLKASGRPVLEFAVSMRSRIKSLETEKENLDSEIIKVKEEKREKESELREKIYEVKSEYEDQVSNLKNELESVKREHEELKSYVSSIQSYNNQLQMDLNKERERYSAEAKEKNDLTNEIVALKTNVSMLQLQNQSLQDKSDSSTAMAAISSQEKDRLKSDIAFLTNERNALGDEVKRLTEENVKYSEMTGLSSAEMEKITNRATALEESFKSQAELISSLRRDVEIGKHRLELAEGIVDKRSDEVSVLLMQVEEFKSKLENAEEQIRSSEIHRRKLHNTIQELKGNIRVFCRVRPLLENEEGNTEEGGQVIQYPDSIDLQGRGIDIAQPIGRHSFTFDKVFGPTISQVTVFEEIEQLIQSALDGYKVCIFAYGQTGSGKTYTMLGGLENDIELGIIPRSLQQIFSSSQALVKQGWNFTMQVTMLEIYNETIRDLLAKNSNDDNVKYTIKHDAQGNTTVTDITVENVCTVNEVNALLSHASSIRAASKTALNERSSRSHCVFTLKISGTNNNIERSVNGVLNLIDLAGSERLSKSNSTGDRLKETQAINKSLSALGDVICAIANRDGHVPFRNSKLTYLLQPCLGGDAKTLMFVNVAPTKQSAHESLCSLRFASKVNSCELGVPRRNATSTKVSAPSASAAPQLS